MYYYDDEGNNKIITFIFISLFLHGSILASSYYLPEFISNKLDLNIGGKKSTTIEFSPQIPKGEQLINGAVDKKESLIIKPENKKNDININESAAKEIKEKSNIKSTPEIKNVDNNNATNTNNEEEIKTIEKKPKKTFKPKKIKPKKEQKSLPSKKYVAEKKKEKMPIPLPIAIEEETEEIIEDNKIKAYEETITKNEDLNTLNNNEEEDFLPETEAVEEDKITNNFIPPAIQQENKKKNKSIEEAFLNKLNQQEKMRSIHSNNNSNNSNNSNNNPDKNTQTLNKTSVSYGVPTGVRNINDLRPMPGNIPPAYDMEDRLNNREGVVSFIAFVNNNGKLSNFKMIKSSGHKTLDNKTYKALKKWRFHTGQAGWVEIPFLWRLTGEAQEVPAYLGKR